ncbi:MAG: hypothetical protein ACE5GX_07300 [Thermoanaerobaculia bacterium]
MTRAGAWILAGLATSVVGRHPQLLPEDDPLTSTLRMLPLVLGLFLAASELLPASASRGSHLGPRLYFGAGLVVLSLARDQLGLRYGEVLGSALVVAAILVLLLWQAVHTVSVLAKSRHRGRREYLAFFLTVLAVYLGVLPWSTDQRLPNGDEPHYLLLTHSLAYDFDTDLANNYEQGDSLRFMNRRIGPQMGDPVGPNGEKYSRHNMTVPLLMAVPYRLLGKLGAFGVMVVLTAALAVCILRIADVYFPERPVATICAASVTALTAPLLTYSHQAWVEVPASLLTAVAFLGLLALTSQPTSARTVIWATLPVLVLPLIKLRFLALSPGFLLLALTRVSKRKRILILRCGVALLLVAAVTMLFNHAVFGQALKHHSWRSLASYLTSPADYLEGPFGIFFDCAFGLFFASPIWILLLVGLPEVFRERRSLLLETALVCTPYLFLLAPKWYWYGGWSPPFRYGTAFLPFLTLFLIPAFVRRREGSLRFLIALLSAATVGLTILWVALPGWTYNFGDGRSLLLDHMTRILGADVARLFPSALRPRTANLIWLIGLSGLLFVAARRSRGRARAGISAAGVATLLLAMAAVPPMANHLPTRVVEFEDPYVETSGGGLWPDQWVPNRPAFRGGWKLTATDEVRFAVTPRDEWLALAVEARAMGSKREAGSLQLLAEDAVLTEVDLSSSGPWSTLAIGPVEWPPEAKTMVLRLKSSEHFHLLLDRAHLRWLEAGPPY